MPNVLSGVIPLVLGVGLVVVSAVVYHLYVSKTTSSKTKNKKKVLLEDPQVKYKLPLVEKEEISHDTRRYRFALPSKEHVLGLPIGQHIHISAKIDDDLIIRSYTPVSSDDDYGFVDLVIKVYFRNVHPKFPDGGKMTQHIDSLNLGDTIDIRGPSGRLQYVKNGEFTIKKMRKDPPIVIRAQKVSMIAGGVGITPLLQLIRHILKQGDDTTELRLLFANQTEQDILVRKELEEVQQQHPQQFKLWYTLDVSSDDWQYSTGFINEAMLREHLFPPSKDNLILMCGPPPMINYACLPNLEKLGHDKDLCFAY